MRKLNPYEGHVIHVDIPQRNGSLEPKDIKVIDGPGFAPFTGLGTIEGIYQGYTEVTGLFNCNYSLYWANYKSFYHEEVDFHAKEGTIVKSLINGKVMLRWENPGQGYGKFLFIQDMDEPKKFYLLGHLSEQLVQEGDIICKGKEVAKTGMSGTFQNRYIGKVCHYHEQDIFFQNHH